LRTSLPESADQPAVVTSKPDFFNGIVPYQPFGFARGRWAERWVGRRRMGVRAGNVLLSGISWAEPRSAMPMAPAILPL